MELRLTSAGRAFLRRAPKPAQVRLLAAFGRLSPADRQALVRGLRSWARAADPSAGAPPLFFEGRAARSR